MGPSTMIRTNKLRATEDSQVEAILAFDRALAAGEDQPATAGSASFLQPVHECQRLLEMVWPRSDLSSSGFPRQFGRFSIVRELGRGGFGIVFLAEDSVLGRRIALKVPRPEVLVTPEIRRRFLARPRRPRDSITRISCRYSRWARSGPSATSPRRTAKE